MEICHLWALMTIKRRNGRPSPSTAMASAPLAAAFPSSRHRPPCSIPRGPLGGPSAACSAGEARPGRSPTWRTGIGIGQTAARAPRDELLRPSGLPGRSGAGGAIRGWTGPPVRAIGRGWPRLASAWRGVMHSKTGAGPGLWSGAGAARRPTFLRPPKRAPRRREACRRARSAAGRGRRSGLLGGAGAVSRTAGRAAMWLESA